jgi:hypothetical protein
MALMTPGAPSEVTNSGSLRPRPFVSSRRNHGLGVLLRTRHQMQQHAAAIDRVAPGRQHRFALRARSQPLGNAVDEQRGELVLAKAW